MMDMAWNEWIVGHAKTTVTLFGEKAWWPLHKGGKKDERK